MLIMSLPTSEYIRLSALVLNRVPSIVTLGFPKMLYDQHCSRGSRSFVWWGIPKRAELSFKVYRSFSLK
jgi:hypothetical protein